MKHKPPTNSNLVDFSDPWFPVFSKVCRLAVRDVLAAIPVLGPPRKTERANDLHRAVRQGFRQVCDMGGFLQLVEEPEGKGLDYVVSTLNPATPISYRWGRFNGLTVRRNPTQRTEHLHEQGTLFSMMDDAADPESMPMLTIGLGIADDYWEANQPCWWLGRVMLLREGEEQSEVLAEIDAFEKPADREHHVVPAPLVKARDEEIHELEELVGKVRRA